MSFARFCADAKMSQLRAIPHHMLLRTRTIPLGPATKVEICVATDTDRWVSLTA
jgi:hypothetical protein